MSLAASMQRALKAQHRAFSGLAAGLGNAKTVTLKLGANTSEALDAAVVQKETKFGYDDRGAIRKELPCVAHIPLASLPAWATVDALPRKGTFTAGGREFKISTADSDGVSIFLTGFYWA